MNIRIKYKEDFFIPRNVQQFTDITLVSGHSIYKIQKPCRLCKKVYNPSREFKWYCEDCVNKYNLHEKKEE